MLDTCYSLDCLRVGLAVGIVAREVLAMAVVTTNVDWSCACAAMLGLDVRNILDTLSGDWLGCFLLRGFGLLADTRRREECRR